MITLTEDQKFAIEVTTLMDVYLQCCSEKDRLLYMTGNGEAASNMQKENSAKLREQTEHFITHRRQHGE